jgi:hypothetical protein
VHAIDHGGPVDPRSDPHFVEHRGVVVIELAVVAEPVEHLVAAAVEGTVADDQQTAHDGVPTQSANLPERSTVSTASTSSASKYGNGCTFGILSCLPPPL